jgi:hypothetical protein
MADIIITAGEQANRWSRQYCRQFHWTIAAAASVGVRPGARNFIVASYATRMAIVNSISRAARMAGPGGRIIYNIGHGYGGRNGANVMLAPTSVFTVDGNILTGDQVIHTQSATINVRLSQQQANIRADFLQIGQALRNNRISQFIFLVCGIGANPAFMQLIRRVWGGSISIGGYNDGVALEDDVIQGDSTYPRTRLYLFRDGAGVGNRSNRARLGTGTSAIPWSWLEMPAGLIIV